MREMEPSVPIESQTAHHLQVIVANLHWRYSGVTATSRMVSPKLANMFRAAWLGPRAAQQRDDRRRAAQGAGLAVETGVHLGGAAASYLDHALADRPDGCDHCHQ